MKENRYTLTEGAIWRALLVFILPILAGSLIQQLYTTVDAIIVGKFLGKEGLAAIDAVGTLFKFPINFLNGLASGATIIISRYYGAKQEEELDCSIHTAFTIAIVLGVIFSIAGMALTPVLLDVMSVPDDIRSMTLIYVRIYFAGLWAMTLYNMVAGVLRAFGDSRTPFFILIVCAVIHIGIDLLLVGVFKTGVAGAAIATGVAQMISAFLAIHQLNKTHRHFHHPVWKVIFCRDHMGQMLAIGMPLALQAILFPIANSMVQAGVNTMGTDTIAAWSVCGKLDMFIWLIADAMNPALATYVAQNIGAGRKDRVIKGSILGTAMSFGAVAVISITLFIAAGPLGKLFLNSGDIAAISPLVIRYMRLMAPFYVFYSFAEAFSGACCGLGDTITPMILTLLCTCALRVVCILFVLPHFNSMECIIAIYIASWIASGVVFIILFAIKAAKLKKQLKSAA